MRSPILYATLISLLLVVPTLFLQGVWGALTQPTAVSYAIALLASMLIALTVTPALSLLLLRDAALPDRESPIVHALRGGFDGLLSRSTGAGLGVPLPPSAGRGLVVSGRPPSTALTRKTPVDEGRLAPPSGDGADASRASQEPARFRRPQRQRAQVRDQSDRVTDVDSSEPGSASIARPTTMRRWPPSRRRSRLPRYDTDVAPT
jgi:hypothetical protein